jgi:hypothetical protein
MLVDNVNQNTKFPVAESEIAQQFLKYDYLTNHLIGPLIRTN